MGTTIHDLWDFIGSVGGKTCFIDHNSVSYSHAHCVTVCFDSESDLVGAMTAILVIKGVSLYWSHLSQASCAVCRGFGHTSLNCQSIKNAVALDGRKALLSAQDQFRLARIYVKKSAPISRLLAFNGKTWASVVGALFVHAVMRNTSGNCKNSLREDPRQRVDFSSAFEKEYINTHNNQKLKNNLHHDIKKKAFSITEKTKVATKTPNLTVLEFCHAIYTQNQSNLGLPEEYCPAESAFTYYINARINYHIGKEKEPHDTKLRLYRELSQYTTKEIAVIATTIVKIHRKIEQYANKNFSISTENTREHANKTKENSETNQKSNQQKLGTPAQTPKKTVTQSIKKQHIYLPEDKSYHFSPENKIQIPLGAVSSSTSIPQTPRTPNYTDKIKQRNWGDIPITKKYSSLFQNSLFQPKFGMGFENCEEESESESEKETSEKTITKLVTETSSQSKNQETRDQEEELDIKEATFRNA
ncbi:hypothetical protein G9A89_014498 [Geosiphon pyriformis]|nr:hypothetical protein G9A89_014498 [Geosiphon pyriformis]